MYQTRNNLNKRSGIKCRPSGYNPVQAQFKSMCDVNNIVRRAFAGDPTVFRPGRPYADVSSAPESLHEALQKQVDARNAYEALPEEVRAKYPTPDAYFAACHDPSQLETLRELGIVNPEVKETAVKVEVVNPEPPKTVTE
jgi:hypothetical protein